MKKGLRLVPLTAAALMLVSGIAAAAPTTVYYTDGNGKVVKASYANLEKHKEGYRDAQNAGRSIVIEDGEKTFSWSDALKSNTKSYADALASSPAVTAPTADVELKADGTTGEVGGEKPVDPVEPTDPTDQEADLIQTTVSEAMFGSSVKVSVDVKGDAEYPAAKKYQVFDGEKAISAITDLGESTTVFPKKNTGDTVTIKLLSGTNAVLTQKVVTLGTAVAVDIPQVDAEDQVNGVSKEAMFGSSVTVSIDVKGESDYPSATKYQVFDGEKAVSSITNLGESTTVFPKKEAGASVSIKLFDAEGTNLATKDIVLK